MEIADDVTEDDMITYDPKTKVVTMNLSDLVHCGFNYDEFRDALFVDGLDDAITPDKLVVNFSDASILNGTTWIASEKYCECRVCIPFAISTGEVRCQSCGMLVRRDIITTGDSRIVTM